MASKRQRKKQQAKKNIELLSSVGITNKKEIKQLKNKPKAVQSVYKKEHRKQVANERSSVIKSFGYKVSDHSSKRYWGSARWDAWVQEQHRIKKKEETKKKNDDDLYLLMFWRDKTAEGFADTELIERYKYQYQYMNNEQLLERINKYLRTIKPQGAEIGTSLCVLVKGNQRKQYINFMSHMSETVNTMSDANDWIVVYEGKAMRYHPLLLAVHAMVRLMYDTNERSDFIGNLIDKFLPRINKKMALRLAKDLNWRGF
ncbi:hypothetical protein [Bacillus sp. ISL-57]|uniref:hypothetical protein n=1 Tax=Bacillus sp. ISL-57 TaxID=2819135 RepID=UPI001BE4F709|nr:hypothetical protein [Bacillus sp. ISL-57]MBT2718062.1 hypothetical protein [Bacillus sp. ISL-57]